MSYRTSAPHCLSYLIIAATLLMRWPVLETGFSVDDYAQLAMMRGYYPVTRAPLSLFTFSDGSQRENQLLRAAGFFPWWSHAELKVSLMRPLSSALMWFDLQLFDRDEYAYHLHSACWWVAMMIAAQALLAGLLPGWASTIALALFSVHPAHNLLLGWIANRNAIVATTFALLGLLTQIRAQASGQRSLHGLSVLAYVLALGAGEYAVGYLVYAVMLSVRQSAKQPLRRLLPWAAAFGGYVIVRAALGYGTHASGMYIDPVREPVAFLSAAFQRLPVLVGDAVLAMRSTWWSAGFPWASQLVDAGLLTEAQAGDLHPLRWAQWSVGLLACGIAAWLIRRALRSSATPASSPVRAFALGLPLAFVPALASLPESRLMLPAVLGWAVLLARELTHAIRQLRAEPQRARALPAAVLLALAALEHALPLSYASAELREFPAVASAVRSSMLAPELDALAGPDKLVLLASAADPTTTIYLSLARRWYGHKGPATCQLLMGGYGPLRLTRVARAAFELQRLRTGYTGFDVYAAAFNRLPLHVGDRFQSGSLSVEVLETLDGRPLRARYVLHTPVDDDSVVLLTQTRAGLEKVELPALGESITLAPAELPLDVHDAHARK